MRKCDEAPRPGRAGLMIAGSKKGGSIYLCTKAPAFTAKTLGWRLHLHPWVSRLRHKIPQVLASVCQCRPPPCCFCNKISHDAWCLKC